MRKYDIWLVPLMGLLASSAHADPPTVTTIFAAPPPAETEDCPGPVTLERRMGGEPERIEMPLLDCDDQVRPEALRAVSVLARPRGVARPADDAPVEPLHAELLERLQHLGDTFEGHAIQIFGGVRPNARETSRHRHARALDLRVDGVPLQRVRDALVTLEGTGVGYYPNSVFVHLDVRDERHAWVDFSGGTARETPAPSWEDLDALRRETEAALAGIAVPTP